MFTHLEVWAPNMCAAEAEPLPPAPFHPRVWLKDLSDPPPDLGTVAEGDLTGSSELRIPQEPPPPPAPSLPSASAKP